MPLASVADAAVTTARIAIIDDDFAVAQSVGGVLREKGWSVSHAVDLASGAALLTGSSFDLIILDRTMPDGDGLSILSRLRQTGVTTPAIVLSAMGDVDNRIVGFASGADDYLSKPFSLAELTARVAVHLNRGQQQAGRVLRAGPLELDLVEHRLVRGLRQTDLLPRESRLLECFMRHADQTLTRAMLLRDVWRFSPSTETNVVDVHVGKLRRKVDAPDETPLLHTVKGVGFSLMLAH